MTPDEIDRIFQLQERNCEKIRWTNASQRKSKLRKLQLCILARKMEIEQALHEDLRKTPQETGLSEIYPVTSEIKHASRHLRSWMEPRHLGNPLIFFGSRAMIRYEPKGLCLILSPWNYPFQLALSPLVSAVAAGNCVILKPSEISVNTSRIIQKLVEETFPEEEVAVIQGDQNVATYLLEKPFHHIFFTGSPAVGKIVMQAAAKNLASVTLELGGKSPVFIDEFYDLKDAARKILWGKLINAGQTCVAPDYLLIPESRQSEFIRLALENVRKMYERAEESPNYCKIISPRHLQRLTKLLENAKEQGARVETGGDTNDSRQYFAPTILSNVSKDSEILNEEIFGPILPIVPYANLDDAVAFVNSKPRPLSLYIFSTNSTVIETILQRTHSGGVCINDVAVHFANVELPFGGVNNSGIGNSHGYFGFRAFSHERAVLKQPKHGVITFFYPPYTEKMKKLIAWTIRYL
jgi:aldehyde dehydrogenase (NAD+)